MRNRALPASLRLNIKSGFPYFPMTSRRLRVVLLFGANQREKLDFLPTGKAAFQKSLKAKREVG